MQMGKLRTDAADSPAAASEPGTAHNGRALVPLALVHHANQYLITNGYETRSGLDETVGGVGAAIGYLKILELHRTYAVPLNLHLSGTLLEALAWYRPDVLAVVRDMVATGDIELIGSSYGQNIMRFFRPEHNLRQLDEQLALYRRHLG